MVEEEGEMKDLDPLEVGLEAVPLGVEAVLLHESPEVPYFLWVWHSRTWQHRSEW